MSRRVLKFLEILPPGIKSAMAKSSAAIFLDIIGIESQKIKRKTNSFLLQIYAKIRSQTVHVASHSPSREKCCVTETTWRFGKFNASFRGTISNIISWKHIMKTAYFWEGFRNAKTIKIPSRVNCKISEFLCFGRKWGFSILLSLIVSWWI